MAIEFNKFGNYGNYNIKISQDTTKKAEQTKEEEAKEINQNHSSFKGLENETDLLTKNAQNLYGIKISKYTADNKSMADKTNEILASLGFNYKVTSRQVESVANGVNTVVLPAMDAADKQAIAARIEDPKGPFADLFAKQA
ncbi:hypothetical protein J6G99_02580 [bacterium]|nr:hypothetical protein [bacterium]